MPGAIPNGFVCDMGLADRPRLRPSVPPGQPVPFAPAPAKTWLVHSVFYLSGGQPVGECSEAEREESSSFGTGVGRSDRVPER